MARGILLSRVDRAGTHSQVGSRVSLQAGAQVAVVQKMETDVQ